MTRTVSILAAAIVLAAALPCSGAGHKEDDEQYRAVIEGRAKARAASAAAEREERVRAAHLSRLRAEEYEAEQGLARERRSAPAKDTPSDDLPWTLILVGTVAVLGVLYLKLRGRG